MLNNLHHEFRCEIYLVKDDDKSYTFCGISIIIIMRIVFSFLHANHVAMCLKEVQTFVPTFTTVVTWPEVEHLG